MSTTDRPDVVKPVSGSKDPIAAALAAVNAARDKVNEVSERVTIDTHNNQDNMYEVRSGHEHVINTLDAYFREYPDRTHSYELSEFDTWVFKKTKSAAAKYRDSVKRGAAALEAANATLRAATKVYEDLVAQKQMYENQIDKLKQQLADAITPIQ